MMTPEQQRVAIAEWCGWKHWVEGITRLYWNPNQGEIQRDSYTEVLLPDFLHDLNAMARAEEGVRYEECEQERYEEELLKVVIRQLGYQGANQLIHATAAQRCEALCRTLWPERWKEGAS